MESNGSVLGKKKENESKFGMKAGRKSSGALEERGAIKNDAHLAQERKGTTRKGNADRILREGGEFKLIKETVGGTPFVYISGGDSGSIPQARPGSG